MMILGTHFEYGMTAFKMMAHDQPRTFKLGQHPVDGSQANILVCITQGFIDIFRTHMPVFGCLKNLHNLDAGQGYLQAGIAQLLIFSTHDQTTSSDGILLSVHMTDIRLTVTTCFGYYARLIRYVNAVTQTIMTKTRTSLNALLSSVVIALLCSCSAIPTLSFPGVYRIDIPQGNIITQEMIDQLRPGLNKNQVTFILGTPLIRDTFDQDRWDYVYSFLPGGGERAQERLTVFFEDNQLTHFSGDFQQTPENDQFGDAN